MFSVSAGCCMGLFDVNPTGIIKGGKKAVIADSILCIIFGIIATLGFCKVLPQAVGIAFCVLGLVNALVMLLMRNCIYRDIERKETGYNSQFGGFN